MVDHRQLQEDDTHKVVEQDTPSQELPLIKRWCITSETPGYHNLWRATHCSMGFFLISIAVNSVSNIQSQALEESGYSKLGFFELAMFYAMFGLGSLFATAVMKRIGPQMCMVLGSVLDAVWIVTSLIPVLKLKHDMTIKEPEDDNEPFYFSDLFVYFIVMVTSILGGLGESM